VDHVRGPVASTLERFIFERPGKYGTEVYSPPQNGRMSDSGVFLWKVEKGDRVGERTVINE
jgi:hypothetical protein